MLGARSQLQGLKSVLVRDPEAIASFEDEWRSLAESRENAFLTPEWYRSWLGHGPGAAAPLIATARRGDGTLAGVLPLVLGTAGRPRMIRFAGARFADRLGPAARPEDEAAVASACIAALEAEGFGRHVLMLDHVDPDSSWWHAAMAAFGGRRELVQQRYELPYIDLAGLDWDGYLATRSRNFRQQLRKRERNLEAGHAVRFRSASPQSLAVDLAHLFRLHEQRWEGRGDSSLQAAGAKERLGAFAAAAQQRGWLRLLLLEADDQPVAAFLGWRLGATFTFYQSGFDPQWADRSVGTVMLARAIRSAIEEGATEFDMLLGSELYKQRFLTGTREVQTVALAARGGARLLLASEANARRLGRGLAAHMGHGRTTRALRRMLPVSGRL